ncbi:hypothetical protein LTR70_000749 [Exophiala xenobiotica]|uniref:Alpha N-terminal protein methyltransferase 1 n=1 Tax=Lithohypha guttulata TaxID=1690604 RepID=A0ABR0KN93_9EURO|nr:hypothetical protein LTR24_000579 [Lithohypha guttulata]KAK5329252.1 hypothetical protein LTR70_000749 [Exophiala xenobiotica]
MATPSENSSPDADLGNSLPSLDSQISHADQISYWSSQSADVNGMLGGYPQLSRIDLQGSKNFIAKVRRISRVSSSSPTNTSSSKQDTTSAHGSRSTSGRAPATPIRDANNSKIRLAVDCGAGIGRITSGLLLYVAETVDIVEPVTKFTDVLGQLQTSPDQGRVGEIFNCGLESWSPSAEKSYDLIWIQWCLGHLADKQAVEFLKRAARALAGYDVQNEVEGEAQGWIMVKENLSTDAWGEDIFDDVDSSVTRSDQKFKHLFEEAGLKIVKMEAQSGFPKDLYPVKMYALRPK